MLSVPVKQVLDVAGDIDGQIYARDFRLIDQSDMIVSLVPELPGGVPGLSSGVERELQHAFEGGERGLRGLEAEAQSQSLYHRNKHALVPFDAGGAGIFCRTENVRVIRWTGIHHRERRGHRGIELQVF